MLGAVVLILYDTGLALGFVMSRERFTFCVRGPWRMTNVRKEGGEDPRKGKGERRKRTTESEELVWLKSDGLRRVHVHIGHTNTCRLFTDRFLRVNRARVIEGRGGAFDNEMARNVDQEIIFMRSIRTGPSLHGPERGLQEG